jgi:hypothetical protein
LTNEYLAYKFTTIVEINEYRDENGVLSAENFPAITFCARIPLFRAIPFLQNLLRLEKHFDTTLDSLNYTIGCRVSKLSDFERKSECMDKIYDIINREQNISNYIKFMNYIPAEVRCEHLYHRRDRKDARCIRKDNFVFSKSLFGECFSLFTNFTHKIIEDQNIENSIDFQILLGIPNSNNGLLKIMIHERNQLPSFGFTENRENVWHSWFEYSMNKFRRLPFPYSTDCFDYKKSNIFKSRGQCINTCYINDLVRKHNCIPKDFQNLTFSSIDSFNTSFCEDSTIKMTFDSKCRKICKLSCEESNFIVERFTENRIQYKPYKEKYFTYVNDPLMTFFEFLSTTGGLLGLWNNLSINDLQILFLNALKKLFETRFVIRLTTYISSLIPFGFYCLKINLFFKTISTKINLKVL